MIYYLTLKKKIYMIEEEWMPSKEINKVVEAEEASKTYFLCLVVVEVEKEAPKKLKLSQRNQMQLQRKYIKENQLLLNIKDKEIVKLAMVKVVKMLKDAINVKVKVLLQKWFNQVLVCIHNLNNIVLIVEEKVKLQILKIYVKIVKVKKFSLKKLPQKQLQLLVCPMNTIQCIPVNLMKPLVFQPETQLQDQILKNIILLQEQEPIYIQKKKLLYYKLQLDLTLIQNIQVEKLQFQQLHLVKLYLINKKKLQKKKVCLSLKMNFLTVVLLLNSKQLSLKEEIQNKKIQRLQKLFYPVPNKKQLLKPIKPNIQKILMKMMQILNLLGENQEDIWMMKMMKVITEDNVFNVLINDFKQKANIKIINIIQNIIFIQYLIYIIEYNQYQKINYKIKQLKVGMKQQQYLQIEQKIYYQKVNNIYIQLFIVHHSSIFLYVSQFSKD